MNKIIFVLSGVLAITGIVTFIVTSILKVLLPKLGYIAYQVTGSVPYSESSYNLNFSSLNILSIILIIIGVVFCIYAYIMER